MNEFVVNLGVALLALSYRYTNPYLVLSPGGEPKIGG